MWYSDLGTFISRHTLHQHWYTCPAAHKSFDCWLSHFLTLSGILSDFRTSWENFWTQLWTALQTNTSHSKQETLLYEYPLHRVLSPTKKKKHNRTLLFYSTRILKHDRHFDYWKQPLNMRMRVFYLHCHEAGLCCYLMIHILSPLQLFYFHLWPIYWFPLVLYDGEW
jgi:hypothetical protein